MTESALKLVQETESGHDISLWFSAADKTVNLRGKMQKTDWGIVIKLGLLSRLSVGGVKEWYINQAEISNARYKTEGEL
jgi:hypothetical protein